MHQLLHPVSKYLVSLQQLLLSQFFVSILQTACSPSAINIETRRQVKVKVRSIPFLVLFNTLKLSLFLFFLTQFLQSIKLLLVLFLSYLQSYLILILLEGIVESMTTFFKCKVELRRRNEFYSISNSCCFLDFRVFSFIISIKNIFFYRVIEKNRFLLD